MSCHQKSCVPFATLPLDPSSRPPAQLFVPIHDQKRVIRCPGQLGKMAPVGVQLDADDGAGSFQSWQQSGQQCRFAAAMRTQNLAAPVVLLKLVDQTIDRLTVVELVRNRSWSNKSRREWIRTRSSPNRCSVTDLIVCHCVFGYLLSCDVAGADSSRNGISASCSPPGLQRTRTLASQRILIN